MSVYLRRIICDLYKLIARLEKKYRGRKFSLDGPIIGSLGECLVAHTYDLTLMPTANAHFDAITKDGRTVEIKTTQNRLATIGFRQQPPHHVVVIYLRRDGSFEECYNGPGEIIWQQFSHRKLPATKQYQVRMKKLKILNAHVPTAKRLQKVR